MKTIFNRTLETTLKKFSIIFFIVAGIGCGYLLTKSYGNLTTARAYESYLNDCLTFQHLIIFFVLDGIILFCEVIENGSGLIANEIHEGTFKLLAAKPNSRSQILCGKIAGVFAGSFILMVLGLVSYYSTLALMCGFDGNILSNLFGYLPVYILYGFVAIIIVLSISVLMSCVMKRKVAAMLPLLAVMIVIFGVLPFYRIISSFNAGGSILDIFDMNYHFASIFKCIIGMKQTITSSSTLAYGMGLFKSMPLDQDVVRCETVVTVLVENSALKEGVVMMVYMIAAAAMYVGSFAIIKKKDI